MNPCKCSSVLLIWSSGHTQTNIFKAYTVKVCINELMMSAFSLRDEWLLPWLPVVAGLSHVCRTLAAAGRIHKVIHNDPHDGSRALELSARDDISTVEKNVTIFKCIKESESIKHISNSKCFFVVPRVVCWLPVGHECQVGAVSTGKCDCANGGADDTDTHRLKTFKTDNKLQ